MSARDILIKVLTKGDPKGAVKVSDALDTLRKKGKLTEDQFQALDQAADKLGKSLTLKLTAPIVGVGAIGLKVFGDFESGMNEVRSLMSGIADEDFGALKAGVAAVGKDLGSLEEASNAAYQAISAGIPPDSLIPFLKNASKDAIAGVTDIATAVDGVSSVLNAYQLPASEASRISDILFSTVKAGKTTFAELSASIYNVAPVASAANIGFEEIGASLATLTKAGVPTTVATTQLRAAMLSLLNPGAEMATILKDAGYESGQAAIKALGFGGALDLVAKSADGDTQKLTKAFGSVEALGAVLGLTGKNAAEFETQLTAALGSAGASAAAFEENNKGLNKELRELKGSALAFAETIGNTVVPAMIPLIDAGTAALDAFVALPGPIKLVGVALAAMAAAAGPAVLVGGSLIRNYRLIASVSPKAAAGIRAVGLAAKTAVPYLAALAAGYAVGTAIEKHFDVSGKIADMYDSMFDGERERQNALSKSYGLIRDQINAVETLAQQEAAKAQLTQATGALEAALATAKAAKDKDAIADIEQMLQLHGNMAGILGNILNVRKEDAAIAALNAAAAERSKANAEAQIAAEQAVLDNLTRQEKTQRLINGLDEEGLATREELVAKLERENALLDARISGDPAALKDAEDAIAIERERQRLLATGVVTEEEAAKAAADRIAKERQAAQAEETRRNAPKDPVDNSDLKERIALTNQLGGAEQEQRKLRDGVTARDFIDLDGTKKQAYYEGGKRLGDSDDFGRTTDPAPGSPDSRLAPSAPGSSAPPVAPAPTDLSPIIESLNAITLDLSPIVAAVASLQARLQQAISDNASRIDQIGN